MLLRLSGTSGRVLSHIRAPRSFHSRLYSSQNSSITRIWELEPYLLFSLVSSLFLGGHWPNIPFSENLGKQRVCLRQANETKADKELTAYISGSATRTLNFQLPRFLSTRSFRHSWKLELYKFVLPLRWRKCMWRRNLQRPFNYFIGPPDSEIRKKCAVFIWIRIHN